MKLSAIVAVLCLGAVAESRAAAVVGGSLLTVQDAAQLETWLGESNLTFTNIFGAEPYPTFTADFHAAADGQGRTITVFQAMVQGIDGPILIGGYNPLSWRSDWAYNYSATDAERTAFIFNLTTASILRQNLDSDGDNSGYYQTYNSIEYGPTFGGGHDIYMDSTGYGYLSNYSYGLGANIAGIDSYDDFTFLRLETYTLSESAVPEPASVWMFGLGIVGIAGAKFRKRLFPRH